MYLKDVADAVSAESVDDVDCNGCIVDFDCLGSCGGSAVEDECGVCGGDGLSCARCSDSTACNYDSNFASAVVVNDAACLFAVENRDCFGACTAGFDCNGTCAGETVVDACGVCGGNETCCVLRSDSLSERRLRVNPAPDTTNPAPGGTYEPWNAPSPDGTTAGDRNIQTVGVVPSPDLNLTIVPAPFIGCEGNCFNLAGAKNFSCFCDDACYTYEDCCDDKEEFCPFDYGQPVPSPSVTAALPSPDITAAANSPVPSPADTRDADFPSPDTTWAANVTASTEPTSPMVGKPKEGSCEGYCLQLYGSHGKMCHCDKACFEYGDCCFDIKVCKGVTTTTSTTTTTFAPDSCQGTTCSGSSTDGSCFCDAQCKLNNDCCIDRDDFCGKSHVKCFLYTLVVL